MSIRVIGAGHVGSRIVSEFNLEGTHRNGPLKFDSQDINSYGALDADKLIVTFAMGNESEQYFEELKIRMRSAKKVLILSSVGAFENHNVIDEETPIVSALRYQRELELLDDKVTLLYLAGIYDESRTPLQWLQKGLVSKQKKGVNLIHTNDIVKVVGAWIENKIKSGKYILSDGFEHHWADIINYYQAKGDLPLDYERPNKEILRSDKILNNLKIKKALGRQFEFTEFGIQMPKANK